MALPTPHGHLVARHDKSHSHEHDKSRNLLEKEQSLFSKLATHPRIGVLKSAGFFPTNAASKPQKESAARKFEHEYQKVAHQNSLGGGMSVDLGELFGDELGGKVKVNGNIEYNDGMESSGGPQSSSSSSIPAGSRFRHSSKHAKHSSNHSKHSKPAKHSSSHSKHSKAAKHSSSHSKDSKPAKHSSSHSEDFKPAKHSSSHSKHSKPAKHSSSHSEDSKHTSKHSTHSTHSKHTSKHSTHAHSKHSHPSNSHSHSSKHPKSSGKKCARKSKSRSSSHNAESTSSGVGGAHGARAANNNKPKFGMFYLISNKGGAAAPYGRKVTNNAHGGRVAMTAQEPDGNLPKQFVITNNPNYGFIEAQNDLYTIRKWAGDLGKLSSQENRNETITALFNAASRYYPDVDTKTVVRIMLADIKAESDFEKSNKSGGRIDSGDSMGLLQVSPGQSSQELSEFQSNVNSGQNTYSWAIGTASDYEINFGGKSTLGPLVDYETGKPLDIKSLTQEDLNKPWVNIHIAMWLQSNYARTGSQDPSNWNKISKSSKSVRQQYQPAISQILKKASSSASSNSESSASGSHSSASSSAGSGNFNQNKYQSELDSLNKNLKSRKAQNTTFATGLGSWVAGAAEDSGGYAGSGDDISKSYFKNIGEGLSVLYTGGPDKASDYGQDWLNSVVLTPGLVDYSS
ncbi:hypothetical protein MVES1_003892 [Malassezia vespertilionis]|uniref:Uncharacterized protein n=1 Tax=Malassezia vespertilionis TaxID=2020962 RepID=A0A2N1J7Z3_9BASI|nr:uncharacterized protein MVES1_003892 [Malassezia vespertilionis]PKI82674.1 hypothetical protein MVES_003447 [Malassezia vespertilionis]WFD08516.1 hypothetical protein MVES1_003892 [Malassezia vespertilionis]